MKAILMSIRPQHLVNILNGKKTIEIRKTIPKCELPIDVYLYCTKSKPYITKQSKSKFTIRDNKGFTNLVNGLVVAKFTLNKIEDCCDMSLPELENKSLLNIDEICSYIKAKEVDPKMVYAWHIDNLEIFDKPKELGEFHYYKKRLIDCGRDWPLYFGEVKTQVRKAPQSWQYIYIEEDK